MKKVVRYGQDKSDHHANSRTAKGTSSSAASSTTGAGGGASASTTADTHAPHVRNGSTALNGAGGNYANGNGAGHWRITRVFGESDEALINRRLPKELLLRVFSHLDVVSLCRCAQVSKAWNVLALDGSNWQRVDLFDFQRDIEGAVVENMARRCGGFLRKLSLKGCQQVGDSALTTFSSHCANIESLTLTDCKKISDRTCQSLSMHCHKLAFLDLSSCSSVSDASLHALGQGCHALVHIDISWCDMITDHGIKSLAEGCRRLESFVAKGCYTLHDDGLTLLARNCTELRKVNVHSCRNLGDDGAVRLAENCANLQYLCVSNCTHLTDASLLALATHCPRLHTLECADVQQFTDTGFQALARNCHLLERMDLEECVLLTDATLAVLAACCPRLESLSLSHCELITDEGIRQLGMAPCASEVLKVLELDNLPLITDQALHHLVGCYNLQRIELYDCQAITRNGIRGLRNHLPNIKVHAYFAPVTPPPSVGGSRQRYCRCCVIL